jgi:hypothetical protein
MVNRQVLIDTWNQAVARALREHPDYPPGVHRGVSPVWVHRLAQYVEKKKQKEQKQLTLNLNLKE